MVHIEMYRVPSADPISSRTWDIAFVGKALDQRGQAAVEFLQSRAKRINEFHYDPHTTQISWNGALHSCDKMEDLLKGCSNASILIESTTLGFPEIFLLHRSMVPIQASQTAMLYVEPASYNAPRRYTEVLARRDFELSADVCGFKAIPGAMRILDEARDQMVVFLAGYEGERLDRAFEQLPLRPSNCHIVFGVPAFRPGWEMDAFSNNVRVMRERQISHGVSFCAAENPQAVYERLAELYGSRAPGGDFFAAPIGTKPHAIAAALFACDHPDVGILYDHPHRIEKRSSSVGSWHVFEVTCV